MLTTPQDNAQQQQQQQQQLLLQVTNYRNILLTQNGSLENTFTKDGSKSRLLRCLDRIQKLLLIELVASKSTNHSVNPKIVAKDMKIKLENELVQINLKLDGLGSRFKSSRSKIKTSLSGSVDTIITQLTEKSCEIQAIDDSSPSNRTKRLLGRIASAKEQLYLLKTLECTNHGEFSFHRSNVISTMKTSEGALFAGAVGA